MCYYQNFSLSVITFQGIMKLDTLSQELNTIIQSYPGTVGLYLHDLETDHKMAINADESFFMASTYKIPMLIQLYRDHEAGLLSIHDKYTLTTNLKKMGYGLLQSFSDETTLSLKDIALLMIAISDNVATHIILEKVTTKRINETLEQFAIQPMSVDRSPKELLADLEANRENFYANKKDNATPRAMGHLLEKLIKCVLTSQSSYQQIKHILNQQILNWRMPRYMLPLKGIKFAHKTGTTNRVVNDVGFIQIPNRGEIILCIYTYQENENTPHHLAEELIGNLTKRIIERIIN